MTTDLTSAAPASALPTPPAAAAPAAPGTPAAPLDLRPGATPPAGVGAALEAIEYTGTVTLGTHTYTLRPKIPAKALIELQHAQAEQDYGKLVDVFPKIIHSSQRDAFAAQLDGDSDNEDDIVALDEILEALGKGLEQIGARPTGK